MPKCLGGSNEEDNLIDLFAKEHFIAHKLLALEHPDNKSLIFAWTCMAFPNNKVQYRYELEPEEYEEAKVSLSKALTGRTLSDDTKTKLSNARKGKPISEETKQKISDALKGRTLSNEWKRKISESNKGKVFSDEHKENISKGKRGKPQSEAQKAALASVCASNKGREHTEEAKSKISFANKGRTFSRESIEKMSKAHKGKRNESSLIKIAQYDLNTGAFIQDWECIMDASRATGIDNSCISKCAKGERKHAGGFVWKFI